MKGRIVCAVIITAITATCSFSEEFRDNFNRINTIAAGGTNTLNIISNNWLGIGPKPWLISDNKLLSSGGSGTIYYSGQETLNSAEGNSFSVSALVAVNRPQTTAYAGIVVHYNPDTDSGLLFRFRADGQVQFVILNNGTAQGQVAVFPSLGFSTNVATTQEFKLTVSSVLMDTYQLEFSDVYGSIMFSTNVVNKSQYKFSDGYAGLYNNSNLATFDDFFISTVVAPSRKRLFLMR